jgi:hypothetical protein
MKSIKELKIEVEEMEAKMEILEENNEDIYETDEMENLGNKRNICFIKICVCT